MSSATARLAPVCAGLFVGGKQAAGARLQLADARLRIGVGRKPLRRAAAAGADHVLPQVQRRARVKAGLGPETPDDHDPCAFLGTTVSQQSQAPGSSGSIGSETSDGKGCTTV